MVADRPLGEDEPRGDLGVAQALGDEPEHLELARRQAGRVLAGRPPRAAREAAGAAARAAGRRRSPPPGGTEALELVERAAKLLLVAGVRPRERRFVAGSPPRPRTAAARVQSPAS